MDIFSGFKKENTEYILFTTILFLIILATFVYSIFIIIQSIKEFKNKFLLSFFKLFLGIGILIILIYLGFLSADHKSHDEQIISSEL